MATIPTKREFYRLWHAGCLGNRLRIWHGYEEWRRDFTGGFRDPVTIRVAMSGGGGSCIYDIRPEHLKCEVDALVAAGVPADALWIVEGAPNHRQTIQGEVCKVNGEWHGCLGRSGIRMRQAMAAGQLRPMWGLSVKAVLDSFMDASSRDDLDAILDLYPDAVVEFTCYDRELGFLPGRNTVFWEVRNY